MNRATGDLANRQTGSQSFESQNSLLPQFTSSPVVHRFAGCLLAGSPVRQVTGCLVRRFTGLHRFAGCSSSPAHRFANSPLS